MHEISPQPSAGHVRDTGTPVGRGVFASRPIAAGELIEVCPVVLLTTPFAELPETLRRILFHWGELAGAPGVSALALGYGSLYNHANPANARYRAGPDGACLVISAARRIEADEEITINYNASIGEPDSIDDNWFVGHGIRLYQPPASQPDPDG